MIFNYWWIIFEGNFRGGSFKKGGNPLNFEKDLMDNPLLIPTKMDRYPLEIFSWYSTKKIFHPLKFYVLVGK